MAVQRWPLLEDVFKLSGLPTYTFVEPQEFGRLLVALRTPGRGVVIEGPSGIGKTTAVAKALANVPGGDGVLTLSARKAEDVELIENLPDMPAAGTVVIDDFHRLDANARSKVADYLKLLADAEDASTKIVVLGINRAGESLIHFAKDLVGRLDVIKFEANEDARVAQLVNEGCAALNIELPVKDIVANASGSFHIAQILCHAACLASEISSGRAERQVASKPIGVVLEHVMDDLSMRFMEDALKFASGPRFSREGRAPYLHILQWLGASDEWTINLERAIRQKSEMRASVAAIITGGHLADFLAKNEELSALIHFDSRTSVVAVEDPKFYFFIRHLQWAKFAERVGFLNIGFTTKYDFALSFAGKDRPLAQALFSALTEREFAVFYDHNEQARILAADVEEYLAPIYVSEASFVICLLGPEYPHRIWTKFESRQFKSRFGAESVIPVIFKDVGVDVFSLAGNVGYYVFDPGSPIREQADLLADLLQEKLAEHRLLPALAAGQFRCQVCALVLPLLEMSEALNGVCNECVEKRRAARLLT